ncbi:unnamed protein product, partial [Polarella glacialis]
MPAATWGVANLERIQRLASAAGQSQNWSPSGLAELPAFGQERQTPPPPPPTRSPFAPLVAEEWRKPEDAQEADLSSKEDLAPFSVGDLVVVKESFLSDSEGGAELSRGQRGEILEIDPDGDAYIRFTDHGKKQWVYSQNFQNLEKVIDRPRPAEPQLARAAGEAQPCLAAQSSSSSAQAPTEAATAQVTEARMWLYNPPTYREMAIRKMPDVDGPRTAAMLRAGQRFLVSEEFKGSDGVLYLKLADSSGWVFESKRAGEVLCFRQEGKIPASLLTLPETSLGTALATQPLFSRGPEGSPAKPQEALLMCLEEAKEMLCLMQMAYTEQAFQNSLGGLAQRARSAAKQESQVSELHDSVRAEAKAMFETACRDIFVDFDFESTEAGQEELIAALRQHEADDAVYIMATILELGLDILPGGWYGMTQLRKGGKVRVDCPSSIFAGETGVLVDWSVELEHWEVQLSDEDEVKLLKPEQLSVLPASSELPPALPAAVAEDYAQRAVDLAAEGALRAARRATAQADEAPWWVSAGQAATARAAARIRERQTLAIAVGSQVDLASLLGPSVAPPPDAPKPRPLEDLLEELDDEPSSAEAQREFRELAVRRRPRQSPAVALRDSASDDVAGNGRSVDRIFRRRGFSGDRVDGGDANLGTLGLHAGLEVSYKDLEDHDEGHDDDAWAAAEARARRGDIRQMLRQHQPCAAPRREAALLHMTGAEPEGHEGLLAVERRNDALPPRVTRSQAAREALERQRLRWNLPPQGKTVGRMPKAHALGG